MILLVEIWSFSQKRLLSGRDGWLASESLYVPTQIRSDMKPVVSAVGFSVANYTGGPRLGMAFDF